MMSGSIYFDSLVLMFCLDKYKRVGVNVDYLPRTGASFLWFGLASCSTGRCSGPSTLINVVGKRNLNGINVYLR